VLCGEKFSFRSTFDWSDLGNDHFQPEKNADSIDHSAEVAWLR